MLSDFRTRKSNQVYNIQLLLLQMSTALLTHWSIGQTHTVINTPDDDDDKDPDEALESVATQEKRRSPSYKYTFTQLG